MFKMIWLDLETGGIDPEMHDITEIAGIIDIEGSAVEEFEFLIHPAFEARVTAQALQVQGKTMAEVMAHPFGQRQAKQAFEKILAKHVDKYDRNDKFIWAGQNPRFDMGFMQRLWRNQGDPYFGSWFDYHPIDIMALMAAVRVRGHFPKLPNFKLASICEAVGVELNGAHRALVDIKASRAVFYKLSALIPEAATI